MSLSAAQFAAALPALRPGLLQWAENKRPCSPDDAEDLVGESVRMALLILPEFRNHIRPDGLRNWMIGILRCVILTDRQRAARRVKTVPIEAAAAVPAPPPLVSPHESMERSLEILPAKQRDLVRDWLDGYSQREIGWRHRRRDCEGNLRPLHRNTVGNRLELAFQSLRMAVPDGDDLTYSSSLIDFCSRVTLYSRPQGVWPSWRHTHPSDFRKRLPGWRESNIVSQRSTDRKAA